MRAGARSLIIGLGAAVLAVTAGRAEASGFQLAEQSARGLGTAFAGGAALADDVTTIFFNPAGLTRVRQRQVSEIVSWIEPSGKFADRGSRAANGGRLTGGEGRDFGRTAWVPAFYVGTPIDEKWSVGLGVNTPFGLVTDYPRDWMGRYHAVTSDLMTINVQPTVAYRIDDQWSVGVGLNVQYIEALLSQKIDMGFIAAQALGPAPAAALGLRPQKSDGHVKIEGDDVSFGWNAGVLYEHDENTRIGFHFRSKISQELKGEADFKTPPEAAPLVATGVFRNSDVVARTTLPETANLSAWHRIDEKLSVMLDVQFTRWNRFRELRIKFENPLQPDSAVAQRYQNTFKYAVGAEYELNDKWDWRVGFAWDKSPTHNGTRTPRLAGNDRFWASFGFTYHYSEDLDFDFGYTHIWVKATNMEITEETSFSHLRGEVDSKIDIAAVSATMNF